MARVKGGIVTRRRHKRLLKRCRGYWGSRGRHYRRAKETLFRALRYAFRDRRSRKRSFRTLWIQRVNAACRSYGLPYSRFIGGLQKAGVALDRQSLSELAIHHPAVFGEIVGVVKQALA
jgi:large subunit ribosomal protein L20